jgi:hypothetical protein
MNVSREVAAPGVLANDEPVKGREGRDRSGLTAHVVSSVDNGFLLFNQDGSFVYTPAADFLGTDSFTYYAHDGVASSDVVTVTLTISEGSTSAPVANDDAYTLSQDSVLDVTAPGVLGNDQKVTGKEGRNRQNLSAQLLTDAGNGNLDLSSDGAFRYTPDAGFSGTDSFTYNVYDGIAISNVALVTVTIDAALNEAPVALADTATVLAGESVLIAVLANDTDDGTLDVSTVTVASGPDPSKGTVAVNADGTITYTSTAAGADTDSFSYTVADDQGVSSSAALVTVTISTGNSAPTADAGVDQTVLVDDTVTLDGSGSGDADVRAMLTAIA